MSKSEVPLAVPVFQRSRNPVICSIVCPGEMQNARIASPSLYVTFKYYKFKPMNVKEMIPAAESAAALMRSLSHPQRLLVLCALVDGEKSVAELRLQLDIEQVPMSQQLMRLRSDGLVEARREGTTVYYSIARGEILSIVGALHDTFCTPSGSKRLRAAGRSRK